MTRLLTGNSGADVALPAICAARLEVTPSLRSVDAPSLIAAPERQGMLEAKVEMTDPTWLAGRCQ